MNKGFIEQLQEIQERPLNGKEQEHLKKYVQDNSFSIKRRLQSKHFISTYGDPQFSVREIFNHSDIIQEVLQDCGYNFSLTYFTFTREKRKYYALIDLDYFRNKQHLLEELANRIYDQE